MVTDTAQLVLDYLSDNWDDTNTDDVTPSFMKITDARMADFNQSASYKDFVLAWVPTTLQKTAGIGNTRKQKQIKVKIDLRTLGKSNETHFRKVYEEIVRIMDLDITGGITGWDEAYIDDELQQELSDKTKGMWRMLIPVTLNNYNIARGA